MKWIAAVLSAAMLVPAPYAIAQQAPADLPNASSQVLGDEITDEQRLAVEKGLAWLAANQKADGSYGSTNGYDARCGITAMAALAFMSNGNLPGRGKYGDNVRKALDYILRNTQESGLISSGQMTGQMYSHGFATLFLAEVYGMTGDEEVKEKLQKAVRLIQRCQNHEGGWRYNPAPEDADISVTICQVMALRAARDAGIKVEKEVIDRAIKYVQNCQNPDGGFSYMARQGGGGGSGFARTAAGVATLYYAGIFEGKNIERGLKYLMNSVPDERGAAAEGGHYYYGQYYAVQAMFLAGGDYWKRWYPAIRKELIDKQRAQNDHWAGEIDEAYATSLALIILQMPNRYLPVFNGKGPGA
jgi:hypothetical protein